MRKVTTMIKYFSGSFACFALLLVQPFHAKAAPNACPNGQQSYAGACLPDAAVIYLTCLKESGGNLINQVKVQKHAGSRGTTILISGEGHGPMAGGQGRIEYDGHNDSHVLDELAQEFSKEGPKNCLELAMKTKTPAAPALASTTSRPAKHSTFEISTPLPGPVSPKTDASGTHKLDVRASVWPALRDHLGLFYIQSPRVQLQADGKWTHKNLRPLAGITSIMFVQADTGADRIFADMVKEGRTGAFDRIPDGATVIAQVEVSPIVITSVNDQQMLAQAQPPTKDGWYGNRIEGQAPNLDFYLIVADAGLLYVQPAVHPDPEGHFTGCVHLGIPKVGGDREYDIFGVVTKQKLKEGNVTLTQPRVESNHVKIVRSRDGSAPGCN